MKQVVFEIVENKALTATVWQMVMRGDVDGIRPGQFVDIRVPELFLRRPISVADVEADCLTIIYKVVGVGTDKMSRMQPGQTLDVLTGLGNGYDLSRAGIRPLLVGGGVGVPPLYCLAKQLLAQPGEACKPTVVLGFNTREEVFLEEAFLALGCRVVVCTADGSYGQKGFVTQHLPEDSTYYYACGPLPMLLALEQATAIDGEMSYEERMGCGFGVCVGCSIQTIDGYKKVCKDGPVFRKGAVLSK